MANSGGSGFTLARRMKTDETMTRPWPRFWIWQVKTRRRVCAVMIVAAHLPSTILPAIETMRRLDRGKFRCQDQGAVSGVAGKHGSNRAGN